MSGLADFPTIARTAAAWQPCDARRAEAACKQWQNSTAGAFRPNDISSDFNPLSYFINRHCHFFLHIVVNFC
jgi:hypothetical protein